MALCLAVVNQKGGVGKSTTAVNLGACLSELDKQVLLVDIDPQGNASSGVGVEKSGIEACMYDVLIERRAMEEVIRPTVIAGLDVAPATLELAGAEIELVSAMSREYRLKESLASVLDRYDYILIDAPPSLGLLTINALSAATKALVPIQCEYYALEGVSQLMSAVTLVKEHLNPDLEIGGVLMTMYDARTNLSQQVVEEVRRYFGDKVFRTIIPRNVRLSEAPSHGQPITLYDQQCRGAQAYRELARELIGA
ncbi:MAG: ParA family protein [Firmicutes bacterium]|nr:ParA family protein [Bacillota bacterium]